jgi:hypothetical protein
MSAHNRVIWSDGLFLQPQHFQQQERYFERFVEERCQGLVPHSWGFTEIEFETDLLSIGKVALRRLAGVFPDGTPFRMPDDDPLPKPLDVGPTSAINSCFSPCAASQVGDMDREAGAGPNDDVKELQARNDATAATRAARVGRLRAPSPAGEGGLSGCVHSAGPMGGRAPLVLSELHSHRARGLPASWRPLRPAARLHCQRGEAL